MRNFTRFFIVGVVACSFLTGCKDDDGPRSPTINCDNPNLTPEQKKEGNCLWNMGAPTDRSKNKGF